MAWFLSPSGWPTSATAGSLFADSLLADGWQIIDESQVQPAIDAYTAGQPLPPAAVDYVSVAEIEDQASPASIALRSHLVARDEAPISLAQRGVSSTKTAAENTPIIQQAILDAEAAGRPVVFPWVPSGSWIDIDDRILIATGGITVSGFGAASRIRQTVYPKPLFEVLGPDTTIEDLRLSTVAFDATGYGAAFRGATEQTYNAGVWAAADRTTVRRLRVTDTYSGVLLSSWDVTLDAPRTPLLGCEVHDIAVDDVVFGLVYGVVDGFRFSGIRGSYRFLTGATTPPHLVYSTTQTAAAEIMNKGVIGADCYARDGQSSFAYQFKWDDGGLFTGLSARGCLGTLHVMDSVRSTVRGLVSYGDTSTSDLIAAIELEGTNDGILIDGVRLTMAGGGKPVRFITGTSNSTIRNADIVSAHTTAATDSDDVELQGVDNAAENCSVRNIGAAAWRGGVCAWGGSGHRIVAPRTSGNTFGVRVRGSATDVRVLDYDLPALKFVTGGRGLEIGAASAVLRPLHPPAAVLGVDRLLVYDMFDRRPGTGPTTTSSGHAWTQAVGQWITDDTGRTWQTSSGITNSVLHVDAGVADCEIEVGIQYKSREGLRLRFLDTTNYLMVWLNHLTGFVEFVSQVAGVNTVVATAAHTPTVGRRYVLGVRLYGDSIEVLVNGRSMFTAVVPADAMTAFGTVTKHGLSAPVAGPTGKFDNFRLRSLT